MQAWAVDQGLSGQSFITMMGDPDGSFTAALDMSMYHPGPHSKGIIGRCKRFALYIEDLIIKVVRISEGPDDPAGDDFPEATLAPAMLEAIQASGKDEL